mgnify:CR=1 FL=1
MLKQKPRNIFEKHIEGYFETEHSSFGPNQIGLNVVTGHNQVIKIQNGSRIITIHLYDQQVIVNCWANVKNGYIVGTVNPSNVDGIANVSWVLPYKNSEIRKLYEIQQFGKQQDK